MITALSPSSWPSAVLEADRPVLVVCSAPWCAPCRLLIPLLEGLHEEDRSTWALYKLDTEDHSALAESLELRSLPTVILFLQGREADRLVGLRSSSALRQWIHGFMEDWAAPR